MTKTIRLTMAQALTRFMTRQMTVIDGRKVPIFGGVWAIFGHGNVAGVGEALYQHRDELPTYRAHNEQAMAHAAIAFAKASFRRRFMAATSSIGPGATNMVTAAALAHVNRLPVLLLPGDVFANRAPIRCCSRSRVSATARSAPMTASARCRAISTASRVPNRSSRRCNRAMQVLTDPAECGPVTLSLCQDVQAEAFDYPESFFAERVWTPRRPQPDTAELDAAVAALKAAKKPVIIAGGGVLYSEATATLKAFAEKHGVPVMETQAGKSSLPHVHPLNMGSVGVTGTSASNLLAEQADVVLAVGSRLQDFTTGSWALFKADGVKIIGLERASFRRRQAQRAAAGRRRHGRAGSARRTARRMEVARRLGRRPRRRQGRLAESRQGRRPTRPMRCRPTRRSSAPSIARAARRHDAGLRLGRSAGRAAQAAGRPVRPAATTWTTAIRPWVTRSPAVSASRSRSPTTT